MAEQPLNVWIVDDDQSVRWVLDKALKQADMQTRRFERAEHLLEAIDEGAPDVLITDVRMPGMSGIALLERLRSTLPDLPIIVITAHSDLENAVAAYKGGAFEYLPKPFDIDEAVALVRKAARANGNGRQRNPGVRRRDRIDDRPGAGNAGSVSLDWPPGRFEHDGPDHR